ncbi:hypothetical protein ACOMHN_067277 [Nucella lapillus]
MPAHPNPDHTVSLFSKHGGLAESLPAVTECLHYCPSFPSTRQWSSDWRWWTSPSIPLLSRFSFTLSMAMSGTPVPLPLSFPHFLAGLSPDDLRGGGQVTPPGHTLICCPPDDLGDGLLDLLPSEDLWPGHALICCPLKTCGQVTP